MNKESPFFVSNDVAHGIPTPQPTEKTEEVKQQANRPSEHRPPSKEEMLHEGDDPRIR
jgi:hypothetical protein